MKANKFHEAIPKDFAVRPLRAGQKAEDKATCGHCGLSWDDAKPTSLTPAPSGRCPFEYFHLYPETVADRLEYLRGELRAERISYGELHELQSLAAHIRPGDVELLEAAGVPEFDEPAADHVAELLDALYMAMPFIEDAESDPAYKRGAVAKVLRQVRAAIAAAEGKAVKS